MKAAYTSWTLLFVVLLAPSIGAQGHHAGRPTLAISPGATLQPKPPPLWLPMPPILTPTQVGPNGQPVDLFRAGPITYAPRYDRVTRNPGYGYYGGGGYLTGGDAARPDPGQLQVDVQPVNAQVFIDGLFVADAGFLRREGGRTLDAGAHRIDVRSEGYEASSIDVRIDPKQTTVYRTQLKPIAAAPAPAQVAAAAPTPKTFYVIPGCYAGDTQPQATQLPPGCDAARLRAIPPVVSRVNAQRQ
jgi:hypothetical protein